MPTALAGMVVEAWNDLDRATAGLSSEDAERRVGTASPISWSVAHLAEHLDANVNARFQQQDRHPFFGQETFRFGAAGDAADWSRVQLAVQEVRQAAGPFLKGLAEADLSRTVPYDGAIAVARKAGEMSLEYALIRVALHHYFHIGEIAAVRNSLGHQVGDYPGMLEACL